MNIRIGTLSAEGFSRHVVYDIFHSSEFFAADAGEVGSFWEPSSEKAVAVLNSAFLVGVVGTCIVNLALQGVLKLCLVEEFASVVTDKALMITLRLRRRFI